MFENNIYVELRYSDQKGITVTKKSIYNTDLRSRKSKIATKTASLILLRNIKSKHKYFILGTNSIIKLTGNFYMNVKYNIKLDHLSRQVEL